MTKKHFIKIAATVKEQLETAKTDAAGKAIESLALRLATDFKTFNPNFNWERFVTACGIKAWGYVSCKD